MRPYRMSGHSRRTARSVFLSHTPEIVTSPKLLTHLCGRAENPGPQRVCSLRRKKSVSPPTRFASLSKHPKFYKSVTIAVLHVNPQPHISLGVNSLHRRNSCTLASPPSRSWPCP